MMKASVHSNMKTVCNWLFSFPHQDIEKEGWKKYDK